MLHSSRFKGTTKVSLGTKVPYILVVLLVFILFKGITGVDSVNHVRIALEARESWTGEKASKSESKSVSTLIIALKKYSKELFTENQHEAYMYSLGMIWQESWFVNYEYHDNKKGFGYVAMLWTTAEDVQVMYEYPEEDLENLPQSADLQAKYLMSYLRYLYDWYDSLEFAVIGYNKGLGAKSIAESQYLTSVKKWKERFESAQ